MDKNKSQTVDFTAPCSKVLTILRRLGPFPSIALVFRQIGFSITTDLSFVPKKIPMRPIGKKLKNSLYMSSRREAVPIIYRDVPEPKPPVNRLPLQSCRVDEPVFLQYSYLITPY